MSDKQEHLDEEIYEDDEDFTEHDYGFIIGPNGELKTMMLPDLLMTDPPKEVRKILKIFGITDVHSIEPKTLH